ncbi:toprim domain-containing protein [Brachyspira pilosicoli]|uniref:toprim domain-containing protein n=1 Tax=Brachyspira pilosicoli TaxID=52584 RepID=UPI001F55A8A8|nr:toprim domain-containing protein [Brachyspira pilosicoli]
MIKKEQIINYSIKNLPKDKTSQYLIIKKLLKNYDENDLIKSGILVKSKEYNNLYLFHHKHRLIIPYFDIDGSTILSIQGRAIDEEIKPKYLFNKNSKDSIYNIHTLGNIRDIIICEGVIDALSLERLGYNAIALSGVTKINLLKQYEILNKYNLYSFSDNDNAGKKLIEKIYKLDNYKGAFLISNFTTNNNIKDINDLLNNSIIKSFKIQGIIYNYFEIPNDKICILDYYIFNKNELKYIKKEKNVKECEILDIF